MKRRVVSGEKHHEAKVTILLDIYSNVFRLSMVKKIQKCRLFLTYWLYFSIQVFEKPGFPGIYGLIDGTLILIKRPKKDVEQSYYSVRKTAHAKNVLLVSINSET